MARADDDGRRGGRGAQRDERDEVPRIDTAPAGTMICIALDDYGLSHGINEAALRLVDAGRLQATGAMVGAPAWRAGVAALRRLDAHGIDIGLHLDLSEHPLPPHKPWALRSLIARSLLHLLDDGALRAQIAAQLDAFEDALGHAPAFVDGHQHVHQLPVVRDVLLAELAQRYPRHRPWLRATRALPWRSAGIGAANAFKAATIQSLGARAFVRSARRLGFARNRRLLGVYGFDGDAAHYLGLLRAWLRAAQDGDLLMCHAGLAAAHGAARPDPIATARATEYELLRGADFGELLRAEGISLWPMSRIIAARAAVA